MKRMLANSCKSIPAVFAAAAAALFLLPVDMAFASGPAIPAAPAPAAPATAAVSVQVPAPAEQPARTSRNYVPFEELQKRSWNPFAVYHGKTVPPPDMQNSPRLDSLIRNGKLYLSLRNAIDLALENNLDLVIARYNLPIAQTDILRTQAGGAVRGVNTGVVSGTPGGGQGGIGTSGAGAGAGGTTSGAGGAGAGASGIVSSTLGTGTAVSSYDPHVIADANLDHTSQLLTNQQIYGVPIYHVNTGQVNASYQEAFPTGSYFEFDWQSYRQTSNSPFNSLNPQLYAGVRVLLQQQLLAGFGFGPNLRYLRIAKTNRKISDIAFRAQLVATITQICDLYWDLVNAYDIEQVSERSVAFAKETLETSRKQLQLQAIPAMDVLKAQGDVAVQEQNLTVARTNLELQELLMKNAITRTLNDPVLAEMPVIPTDQIGNLMQARSTPVQTLITEAMQNRTELMESALDMKNRELSRKTARNAMLPSLSLYGFYAGTGFGGVPNPQYIANGGSVSAPEDFGGAVRNAFNASSPEYQVGFHLDVPLRNRVARADQYRTELEYRQAQVYFEELKKRIVIEVRNANYALEQGASRVAAAREARDLAAKTLDIMQKEQKLSAGSNQQTLAAENELAQAESALVTAETAYEKARIEVQRATGTILQDYGISIADARTGIVEASHK